MSISSAQVDSTWQHTWPYKQDVDKGRAPFLDNALLYQEPLVPQLHDALWYNVPERDDVQGAEMSHEKALPPYSG